MQTWMFGILPAGKVSGHKQMNEYIQTFVLIRRYLISFCMQLNEKHP